LFPGVLEYIQQPNLTGCEITSLDVEPLNGEQACRGDENWQRDPCESGGFEEPNDNEVVKGTDENEESDHQQHHMPCGPSLAVGESV
jgi:hypothetical protein